ncbi:MAG: hypothetical protein L0154_17410 [Chloroflexi bacterium]|nr:hypothetical protein [Chloroflexota bacterium]
MTQNKNRLPVIGLILGIGLIGCTAIVALGIAAFVLLSAGGDDNDDSGSDTAAGQWRAYLYNMSSQEIVRVNEDGDETRVNVPLVEGEFTEGMAVGQPGVDRAAFCSVRTTDDSSTAFLNVLDLNTGTQIQRHEMGSMSFCRVAPNAISPSGDRVAVALVDVAGQGDFSWRLSVIDVDSGATVNAMSSTDPQFTALGTETDRFSIMPDVRLFEHDRLIFAVIPWQTEGMSTTDAFDWDLTNNTLVRVPQWGSLMLDYLPSTGELAWADLDDSRPAGQPGGPIPVNNVVRVMGANNEVRTVYYSGDWLVVGVEFIDGGQALAALLIESADLSNAEPGQQATKLIAMARSPICGT